MAKMQVVDTVQVTRNKMVKKRFPQVGGVGGRVDFGEESANMEQRKGTKDQEKGTRIARAGDWTVVIMASHLRLLPLCAWGGKLSAKQWSVVSDQ